MASSTAGRGPSRLAQRAIGRARAVALKALGRTTFGTVTSVATPDPLVALTFDDGPDPRWTPLVLDVLAAHGAKATFFVVGSRAAQHPELVARLHAEGHALGNHTQHHPSFPTISSAERRTELRDCANELAPYPQRLRLFRPPHLDQDLPSRFDSWRLGYTVIACNRHVDDWKDRSSSEMTSILDATLQRGDIVLLHDAVYDRRDRSRAAMIETLDTVLHRKKDQFRFVTVPDLMGAGHARREIWLKRPPRKRALRDERVAA